jgi:hypothetical protein
MPQAPLLQHEIDGTCTSRLVAGCCGVLQAQVHPAPGPEEVNWQHLWMTWRERDCRTILTWPLMLLVVLFPITLVTSAASRLEYVFCPQVDQGQPTVSGSGLASQCWLPCIA